jgi:hypothetical protein
MFDSNANTPTRHGRRGALALLAGVASALLLLVAGAPADTAISGSGEGAGQTGRPRGLAVDTASGNLYVADSVNHRVDVFNSEGNFALAFGWGVADGAPEAQTCGPAATPPTATCQKGLLGGGAGEFGTRQFSGAIDVAVDNSSGPSQHDVYVVDWAEDQLEKEGHGDRVEKFTPTGQFLLAWGGGVITAGAKGTGDINAGSTQVSAVQTTERDFEVGQVITAAGKIPAGTTIVALGAGTITLSKPAIGSGTATSLSVAAGPGNSPSNERQVITLRPDPGLEGTFFALRFATPNPSPSEASTGLTIPYNASPAAVQAALESLPNIGAGNVAVTSPNPGGTPEHVGGPYTIEFKGARYADTNVDQVKLSGLEGANIPAQNGHGAAAVCTAEIASSCSSGVEGRGDGQLADPQTVRLAVGPTGNVYAADSVTIGGSTQGPFEERIQLFEPLGGLVEALTLPGTKSEITGVAVDSGGDFYISTTEGVRRYDAAGNLVETHPGGSVRAISIDAADHLFVAEGSDSGNSIAEYDSAGKTVRRFGYGLFPATGVSGLASYASASGDLYTSEEDTVFHRFFPPAGPLIFRAACKPSFLGNTRATLSAEVNPEGKASTFHFEYITDADFLANGKSFAGAHPATSTAPTAVSIDPEHEEEELFELHKVSAEATLVPETKYHCRVVATSADAPSGLTGPEGAFTSLEPLETGPTWATGVETDATTLNAEVNPLGIATTGYFEYVQEATYLADTKKAEEEARSPGEVTEAGFEHAAKAPAVGGSGEPLEFGEGEDFVARSAAISGLSPGTSYRYRIVVTDPLIAPREIPGSSETFRTFLVGEGALPDHRAYELVSPAQKNSAEVFEPGGAGEGLASVPTYVPVTAAASSGEALTYASWTAFEAAKSAPPGSQYISRRGADGWRTENISPAPPLDGVLYPATPNYRGFDPELGFGALVAGAAAPDGEVPDNLYLRDGQTGALATLTTGERHVATKELDFFCLDYAGASTDGSRAFFAANGSFAGVPAGENGQEYSLYEWSAADGLRPIDILPGATQPLAPSRHINFGAVAPHCQETESVARHVVSADGRRVFWSYGPSSGGPSKLLAFLDGQETVQLDERAPGATGTSGGGVFQAASSDGSVVLFTDDSRLVKGAGANTGEPDLYRYQFGAEPALSDLTPESPTPGSEAAGVKGLVGASDDGSYIYFVATGVLSGEQQNTAGEKAVAGADNLYLSHEGQVSFVAILGSEETAVISASQPKHFAYRVTPNGRHLAFLSVEAKELADYDNTVSSGQHCRFAVHKGFPLEGGPLCPEAFIYSAETGALACASCNPSGARPSGPSALPGWSNPFEGPRYLSDDGQRLYFESQDRLLLADKNEKRDVYEFELAGNGTCSKDSPSFDPASGGCHFLISSGQSEDESYLADASPDGRDVFFSTRQALLGRDTNENYDLYDAREGGGFPESAEPSPCEGTECKPSLLAAPLLTSPVSDAFFGSGNLVPPVVKPSAKKPLTNAQRFATALKACRKKHNKHKRAVCRVQARKRYGPKSRANSHKAGK